jgi:hypothetical protein
VGSLFIDDTVAGKVGHPKNVNSEEMVCDEPMPILFHRFTPPTPDFVSNGYQHPVSGGLALKIFVKKYSSPCLQKNNMIGSLKTLR